MYNPDSTITTTAKNYNIQERDVIFCHLVANGITRADAFYFLYDRNSRGNIATPSEADTNAAELLKNKPGLKILIHKLKTSAAINTPRTQDEVRRETQKDGEDNESRKAAELKTRSGLTKRLREEIAEIHGKDSVQGIIQLAKLEGYDKEDTRTEEEKRKYFLPWRTKCRGCKLMQLYRDQELTEEEEKSK